MEKHAWATGYNLIVFYICVWCVFICLYRSGSPSWSNGAWNNSCLQGCFQVIDESCGSHNPTTTDSRRYNWSRATFKPVTGCRLVSNTIRLGDQKSAWAAALTKKPDRPLQSIRISVAFGNEDPLICWHFWSSICLAFLNCLLTKDWGNKGIMCHQYLFLCSQLELEGFIPCVHDKLREWWAKKKNISSFSTYHGPCKRKKKKKRNWT